jgi:ATP-dependent protease HslVU (ClpYQ) peptidase subunit
MSVIAVKVYDNKIEIAADSRTTYGKFANTPQQQLDNKLFKIKDIVIGMAGYSKTQTLFQTFLESYEPIIGSIAEIYTALKEFRKWREEICGDEKDDEKAMYAILISEGKAYIIEDYAISEVVGFAAVGSGMTEALVAFDFGATPKEAVVAAVNHNIYCSEPIIEFIVKKGKKK